MKKGKQQTIVPIEWVFAFDGPVVCESFGLDAGSPSTKVSPNKVRGNTILTFGQGGESKSFPANVATQEISSVCLGVLLEENCESWFTKSRQAIKLATRVLNAVPTTDWPTPLWLDLLHHAAVLTVNRCSGAEFDELDLDLLANILQAYHKITSESPIMMKKGLQGLGMGTAKSAMGCISSAALLLSLRGRFDSLGPFMQMCLEIVRHKQLMGNFLTQGLFIHSSYLRIGSSLLSSMSHISAESQSQLVSYLQAFNAIINDPQHDAVEDMAAPLMKQHTLQFISALCSSCLQRKSLDDELAELSIYILERFGDDSHFKSWVIKLVAEFLANFLEKLGSGEQVNASQVSVAGIVRLLASLQAFNARLMGSTEHDAMARALSAQAGGDVQRLNNMISGCRRAVECIWCIPAVPDEDKVLTQELIDRLSADLPSKKARVE